MTPDSRQCRKPIIFPTFPEDRTQDIIHGDTMKTSIAQPRRSTRRNLVHYTIETVTVLVTFTLHAYKMPFHSSFEGPQIPDDFGMNLEGSSISG